MRLNLLFSQLLFSNVVLLSPIFCISIHEVNSDGTQEVSWVVQTNTGPVEGTIINGLSNEDVYVFFGIPYAKPPIKELRFSIPQPVAPWTEILKATKEPLPCYQHYSRRKWDIAVKDGTLIHRPWSEDCLKLNIWTSIPKPENDPVLVFIHSGLFLTGSGTFPFMDGSALAARSRDIVVTMNYRLGVFGFLNLGFSSAPGNVGLLDQQLALKWVRGNIQYFGGNKDAILLVGAGGAGSASVGYHMIAPSSEHLFNTSALIGGAPTCSWAFQTREESLETSRVISTLLSCDDSSIENVLACLRNAHPEDLVGVARSELVKGFYPTVDGTFITEPPADALNAGHFSKKPTLIWTDSHESSAILQEINPDVMSDPENGIDMNGFRKAISRLSQKMNNMAINVLASHYVDKCNSDDHKAIRDAAIRLYSDAIVDCCVKQFMEYIAQHGGLVTHTVCNLLRDANPSWLGAEHGQTYKYILGYPLAESKYGYSKDQANMSTQFIIWINDHTRRSVKEVDEDFEIFNLETKPYIYWDAVGPVSLTRYREEDCKLWKNVIPELLKYQNNCVSN